MFSYNNGNCEITLESDGTRIITYPDSGIQLDYPLNIDIRVSSKCSFGYNPKTNSAICDFCHESAQTDGIDADYNSLLDILQDLPVGIELAVGANHWTDKFVDFLRVCKSRGHVVNVTVNQGHISRDIDYITYTINNNLVNGLGISYRSWMKRFPYDDILLAYPNTVVHVICGIDSIDDVKRLSELGVKKILVLGEKNFGFNKSKFEVVSHSRKLWFYHMHELFKLYSHVSFDNLAITQLKPQRFILNYDKIYQHEYSFYINAVEKYFSPSSRSDDKHYYMDQKISVKDYFQQKIL